MTAPLWLPGAERIPGPHSAGLPMLRNNARRAITWHRTGGGSYASNRSYLVQEAFEPTILWEPWTGQFGQFFPADRGGYALKHVGDPATNTFGTIHVQVEVVDRGSSVHLTDTPMKGWAAFRSWLHAWGIPETLPAGPMLPLGAHKSATTAVWGRSGHFGHCHVPENDHTDPGLMDFSKLFTHAPVFTLSKRLVGKALTLRWTDAKAIGYEVYRDGKPHAHTTALTAAESGSRSTHTYRVLAVAPDGRHTWSNTVTVTFP